MLSPAVSPDTAVFFYQKGVFYLINENKIRILYIQPGKHPEERFAMNELRTLQQLVGGDMQAVYPWSKDDVALICNDSGKVDGLPLNRSLEDYDIIAGNFFICGFSGEEFCSLTDKQFRYYEKLFRDPELFLPTPIGIMGIALSIEHGQGLVSCGQILAFVCPRVSIVVALASLKLLQHVTVGKFRGGFGGSIEICVRVAQIVAVGGSAIIIGGDCDFTNISATSDFADIIAVGNLSVHIKSADTSGVATAVVASAGDFSDVIAIADY